MHKVGGMEEGEQDEECAYWEVIPPPGAPARSLATLADMQEQRQLCDVVLETEGGGQIQAHRTVLAACSPYFRAMFVNELAESSQKVVFLKDVCFNILEAVVSYAYNRSLVLPSEQALLLLIASDRFQIAPLFDKCCDFLETQLRPSNCLSLRAFAELHNCKKLFQQCTTFVFQNFEEVIESSDYLSLPCDQLKELISMDDIRVSSEDRVYRAVVQWVYHDLEGRKTAFPEIMNHVRLPFVSQELLTSEVEQEELMKDGSLCQELIREAYLYKSSPEKRPLLKHSPRANPRKPSGLQDVILVAGGMSKSQPLSSVEQYDGRLDAWTVLTDMEIPRYGLALCYLDGCLFTVGGYSQAFGYLNTLESYSLKEDKWRYHAVAVLYGLIYAVGGQSPSGVVESVERYNPADDSWSMVQPLVTQRMYHGVTEANKLLYAIGGHDGRTRLRSVEIYDPAKDQWTTAAPMTHPRSVAGVASIGHVIYTVGGYDGSRYLDSVEYYDTELDVWSVGVPLSNRRSALGLVAYDGGLYACGGFGGGFLSSVEKCVHGDVWAPVVGMQSERVHFGITCT